MDMGSFSGMKKKNEPKGVVFADQAKKRQQATERERRIAEQMLANRLERKKKREQGGDDKAGTIAFGGYTGLKGKIEKFNVTKTSKKLGVAIDGGVNTEQEYVIIRHMLVSSYLTILCMYINPCYLGGWMCC